MTTPFTRDVPDATGRAVTECDGLVLTGQSTTNQYLDYDPTAGGFVASPTFVSQTLPVATLVTGSRPLTKDDVFVPVDTASGAVTLTLPLQSSDPALNFHGFRVKDATGHAATHNVTVACTSPNTFHDGATSKVISTNFGHVYLVGLLTLSGNKHWVVFSAA